MSNRKIIIDCGANMFQGITKLIPHYKEKYDFDFKGTEIFAFEPNTELVNQVGGWIQALFDMRNEPMIDKFFHLNFSRQKTPCDLFDMQIHLTNKAVWVEDTMKTFYQYQKDASEGSTLEKWKTDYDRHTWEVKNKSIDVTEMEVECISLSNFIKENFDKDDHIILKLDVEGSECEIIMDLIEKDVIGWIDALYVEFHSMYWDIESFIKNDRTPREDMMHWSWDDKEKFMPLIDYVLSNGKSMPGMNLNSNMWIFNPDLQKLTTDENKEVPMRVLTEFKTIKALEENNVNWELWG